MFGEIYKRKRVLVTGHTGFKGSWLCEWLLRLGAEVAGFSLYIPTPRATNHRPYVRPTNHQSRITNHGITDRLGGKDPYSASKACAEIAFSAYWRSFFAGGPQRLASTRAGNVIGGGDWARDRIVPDCIRAWSGGNSAMIRSPVSTRPWQHVLGPPKPVTNHVPRSTYHGLYVRAVKNSANH